MTDTLRDKLIKKGWVTPFNADTLVRLIEEHYADEPAAPAPPADGEVAELVKLLQHEARDSGPHEGAHPSWCAAMERVAELLQRQALVPVPVSERLPDEGDPTECRMPDGSCWWFDPHGDGGWYLDTFLGNYTHWLPAHALPLPEVAQ